VPLGRADETPNLSRSLLNEQTEKSRFAISLPKRSTTERNDIYRPSLDSVTRQKHSKLNSPRSSTFRNSNRRRINNEIQSLLDQDQSRLNRRRKTHHQYLLLLELPILSPQLLESTNLLNLVRDLVLPLPHLEHRKVSLSNAPIVSTLSRMTKKLKLKLKQKKRTSNLNL